MPQGDGSVSNMPYQPSMMEEVPDRFDASVEEKILAIYEESRWSEYDKPGPAIHDLQSVYWLRYDGLGQLLHGCPNNGEFVRWWNEQATKPETIRRCWQALAEHGRIAQSDKMRAARKNTGAFRRGQVRSGEWPIRDRHDK